MSLKSYTIGFEPNKPLDTEKNLVYLLHIVHLFKIVDLFNNPNWCGGRKILIAEYLDLPEM